MKKKTSLMIAAILVVQIALPFILSLNLGIKAAYQNSGEYNATDEDNNKKYSIESDEYEKKIIAEKPLFPLFFYRK